MLLLSLVLNAALLATIAVVVFKARSRIVEEKCSTFAGCVAAITSGLALEDSQKRFEAIAHGLSSLSRRTEAESDMKFYLGRASLLRMFRKAALADVSEHLRLLALESAGSDDEPGDEILNYISKAQSQDEEPRDVWGDDGVAAANFVAERKVLQIYRSQISRAPIRLF